MNDFKKPVQKPLTGLLDVRSEPDNMASGSFRFRQNFASPNDGSVCRRPGFEKFLSSDPYGNEDYHDQLLPLEGYYDFISGTDGTKVTEFPNAFCGSTFHTRDSVREYVTFMQGVQTTLGSRRFIIGTQSRLAVLNETTKNYRLLADGYGGPFDATLQRRWYAGQVKNTLVFTNNYDQPVSWVIDDYPKGCAMQSVQPILDLDLIALTKASCIVSFRNCIILANVVMDGQLFTNRLVWSDKDNAISFDPAKADSVSGFGSLDDGEVIIEVRALNDNLFIFTNTGIWIGQATGVADDFFSFNRIYRGPNILAYRNTLVNTGLSLGYLSIDGFYLYNTFSPEPQRPDWVHYASGVIYEGISGYERFNKNACASHCAGFDENLKEIWISWAEGSSFVPTKSLVINMNDGREHVDTVDHGFTTFCQYKPDRRPSFRDFLLSFCACTVADLEDQGFKFYKEALPSIQCPAPGKFIPQSIYTSTTVTQGGITTEDFAQEEPDSDSLCALLDGATLESLCNECANTLGLFVGASSQDKCLKQIGTAYYREICTNADTGEGSMTEDGYVTFDGTYSKVGYYSIIRSAPDSFGVPTEIKTLGRVKVECSPEEQAFPCVISLRIGRSYSCLDPNNTTCSINWANAENRWFKCPLTKTAQQYADSNTRPDMGIEWAQWRQSYYLYWELTIANLRNPYVLSGSLRPAVGGVGCLASITRWIKVEPTGESRV